MKDNRCTIPFSGYAFYKVDTNSVAPCCKMTPTPVTQNGLLNSRTIEIRQFIKENKQHPECIGCWTTEQLGGPSYRLKNSRHFYENVDWDKLDVTAPHKKITLSFSNKCQMMCVYCGPHSSSMWEKKLLDIPIKKYVDKKIVDDILLNTSFEKIGISGGEPLLDENCLYYLNNLEFDPNRKLSIITNLSYGPSVFESFLNIINRHPNIEIFCSIDAIGENKSRKYLNWELWDRNFKNLADNLQNRTNIYSSAALITKTTVGIMNYKDIGSIIEYVLDFRLKGYKGISFDLNVITDETPTSLSSGYIDEDFNIEIDKKYENILSIKENLLIKKMNNMIKNIKYDENLARRTEEYLKIYNIDE